MYYKQLLSNSYSPFIHANGPSKYDTSWDLAVRRYFKEPPVKGTCSDELSIVTWSIPTERTLLQNCFKHYNIENRLIVIPMKKPFDFLDKIRKMYTYLDKIKTKYVMALDATDVMPFGYDACDIALSRFKSKNVKAVFSAEIEQWPNPVTMKGITRPIGDAPKDMGAWIGELKKVRRLDEVYSWLGSPFKHLCSGAWIGEREYMLGFYKECMDIIPEGWYEESLFGGDQGFIQLVAGRRFPDVILDSKSEIFLNLAFTSEKEVELMID
tara:strand:+ start:1207 stop:2010 length:804 start_codon:yes stop_codon:yes gene_type:complete